eukprot:TRINITY_DN41818_c0_g1_i1.p1 TRINITY_DN41818_c0_g1~~TRINITY_DN41818_c0_g1_i1.p1  ORF type:complete len:423 (+),score=35.71 TRINITY_DN41818_c0_g1_i1:139-1269(+)
MLENAPVTCQNGRLRLGGWQVVAFTDTTVSWQDVGEGEETAVWHRPTPEVLSGPWQSDRGGWRNVVDGYSDGDLVCVDNRGRLVCGGWTVAWLNYSTVNWDKDGETHVWIRPKPETVDGPWINSEGLWRNIEGGRLPDAPIVLQSGRLVCSGWRLAQCTTEHIVWEKPGRPLVSWRRPKPEDLDGPWLSSQDGWRNVIHGRVQDVPIMRRGGQLTFNGWIVTAVTELSLRWSQAGHTIEWHRPWRQPKLDAGLDDAVASKALISAAAAQGGGRRNSRANSIGNRRVDTGIPTRPMSSPAGGRSSRPTSYSRVSTRLGRKPSRQDGQALPPLNGQGTSAGPLPPLPGSTISQAGDLGGPGRGEIVLQRRPVTPPVTP